MGVDEPHVIRLRRPWDLEPSEASPSGVQRWRRRFGRPTGLSPSVVVRLVIQTVAPVDEVRMNGAAVLGRIASNEQASVSIGAALSARNTLEVLVSTSAELESQPDFEIWLEISES